MLHLFFAVKSAHLVTPRDMTSQKKVLGDLQMSMNDRKASPDLRTHITAQKLGAEGPRIDQGLAVRGVLSHDHSGLIFDGYLTDMSNSTRLNFEVLIHLTQYSEAIFATALLAGGG